ATRYRTGAGRGPLIARRLHLSHRRGGKRALVLRRIIDPWLEVRDCTIAMPTAPGLGRRIDTGKLARYKLQGGCSPRDGFLLWSTSARTATAPGTRSSRCRAPATRPQP